MRRRRKGLPVAEVERLLLRWFGSVEYEIGSFVTYPACRPGARSAIWVLLGSILDLETASEVTVDHPLRPLLEMRRDSDVSGVRRVVDIAAGVAAIANVSRMCRAHGCWQLADHQGAGLCFSHDWRRRRDEVQLAPIARVEPSTLTSAEAADAE